MAETLQVKFLRSKRDLVRLVAGDKVAFGVWEEVSMVHNYPGIKSGELFLVSRLEMSGVPEGIGIIFERIDNLRVRKGYVSIKGLRSGDLPKTPDGCFNYGISIIVSKAKDERTKKFENPERYKEFNELLNRGGL